MAFTANLGDCRHCSTFSSAAIICGYLKQRRNKVLTAIKFLHTAIWAFLAGSIMALPVAGVLRRFRRAAIITGIILLEGGVLATNGGRCPLTDLAARYTVDRRSNFDICLPSWLAEHNKVIFGTLFFVSEVVVVACWLRAKFPAALRIRNCASQEPNRTGQRHAGV